MTNTVGVDIGGTNLRAAIVSPEGRIIAARAAATQAGHGFEHVFSRLVALIRDVLADEAASRVHVARIGVGVPGPMSHARGIVYNAPNLPGWKDIPLRDRIVEAMKIPTVIENDANAAAYGEFHAGAGRGASDMVMLTLGTGVGAGVIIDGRLIRGWKDTAGEVGHTIVVENGRPCGCGQRGCLERYTSASAIAERTTERIRGGANSSLATTLKRGDAIDAAHVARAAREGDPLAGEIWDDACRYLAIACVNLQHTLNPQRIVLAGGLIGAAEQLLTPIKAHFERLTWRMTDDFPEIALASLGGDAGLIGAAALARVASN